MVDQGNRLNKIKDIGIRGGELFPNKLQTKFDY